MPTYDMSTLLKHRNGKPFTCRSLGLVAPEIFDNPEDFARPAPIGEVLELILLYTINVPPDQRLSPEVKRNRFATSLKVRDQSPTTELTEQDVATLRDAISVLRTEPFGQIDQFLSRPG